MDREVATDALEGLQLLRVELLELGQRPLEELDVVQLPFQRAVRHLVVVVRRGIRARSPGAGCDAATP